MPFAASRRSFLGASAGALALSRAARSATSGPDGGDLKLGVASYSFRDFGRSLAIDDTKKLNVHYINIKDFHLPLNSTPEEIAKARKEFEKAGLTILGGGNVSFQKNDEADIRQKFEYAKAAGMPLIVCAPTHETLPKMEKYVKEYNIKIAVHNHGPEDKHFPTPQSVLEAVKNMDPRCGLCMDIGHTARTGVDVVRVGSRGRLTAARHARERSCRSEAQRQPGRSGRWRDADRRHLQTIEADELSGRRDVGIRGSGATTRCLECRRAFRTCAAF